MQNDAAAPDPTPLNPLLRVRLEEERGRWWVVFEVTKAGVVGAPPTVLRHRIASYATERQAAVAAKWMRSAADRPITSRHLNP